MNKKIICALLSTIVFIMCYPMVFIIIGSFTSNENLMNILAPILSEERSGFVEWSLFSNKWSLDNYKELLLYQPGFFVLFWNSVKICAGVIIGQLVIAVPAAWGFSKYEFRGRNILFTVYIIFMLLPFQVLMLSEYMLFNKIGLLNSLWAIILPGIFSTFPVFIMRNFFMGVSKDIVEAGRIDGASEFKIFLHIGIPAGIPGIGAIVILQFIEYWNLIEQPMIFLEDSAKWPLSLYLPSINLENAGIAMCAAVITMIPSYLIFRIGENYLEEGIAATNIKR